MPDERLKDPRVRVMLEWRRAAQRAGLDEYQQAALAARFAGLAVIRLPVTGQGHAEALDVCQRIMFSTAFGADAVNAGVAVPRRAVERSDA